MDLARKLTILTDAAKYDASCASSAAPPGSPLHVERKGALGGASPMGLCHSWTPDGRCITLLKVLLSNHCAYECAYCVSRSSSDAPRAAFTVRELVDLTQDFYLRNYIEGLFLSSAVAGHPDTTMERLVRVARTLKAVHGFGGYIHLKVIAGADPMLVREAARWADRLSANVELPTDAGLARLAPDKRAPAIRRAMGCLAEGIREAKAEPRAPRFAPAGQSTQMLVGADAADDATILTSSAGLYRHFELKRVYYSAFVPVNPKPGLLPTVPPPLVREHRLYQADWLTRFYGFSVPEILTAAPGGMLDLHLDPKTAWALAHRGSFPVDVNLADREQLLRVPGLGVRSVQRILDGRRHRRLRLADLARLRVSLDKLRPFVICADYLPPSRLLDGANLRARFAPPAEQLPLPVELPRCPPRKGKAARA